MVLQSIEKAAIRQGFGREKGYVGSLIAVLRLLYCALNDWVYDEVSLWNLHILLEMEQRELELSEFLLCNRYTWRDNQRGVLL